MMPTFLRPSFKPFIAAAAVLFAAMPASAAQVVAMDIQPLAGVKRDFAQTLTPMLIAEVAQLEGMSVISQADIRALLQLEADKQSMGCDDSSCMADIAGSLGAELLMTSSIGRVGDEWVVNVTLIQVEGAKVIRRATKKLKGKEGMAPEAVSEAVHELFRTGLPAKAMGPASLSRRAFKAALAGMRQSVVDMEGDAPGSRRRVILDIVNTELDYDAEPKLDMLDLEIRRGRADIIDLALGAKNKKEFDHYVKGLELYTALFHDLGRVKEIRNRARERGVVPAATALRFETPDAYEWPEPEAWQRYLDVTKGAREVAKKAVVAYEKKDQKGFIKLWAKDKEKTAEHEFTTNRASEEKRKTTFRLLPTENYLPDMQERAISSLENETQVVYLLKLDDGKPVDTTYLYLKRDGKTWVLTSW